MFIPGNDDAFRAIRLYATAVADAIIEGKQQGMAAFEDFNVFATEELDQVALTDVESAQLPTKDDVVEAAATHTVDTNAHTIAETEETQQQTTQTPTS